MPVEPDREDPDLAPELVDFEEPDLGLLPEGLDDPVPAAFGAEALPREFDVPPLADLAGPRLEEFLEDVFLGGRRAPDLPPAFLSASILAFARPTPITTAFSAASE